MQNYWNNIKKREHSTSTLIQTIILWFVSQVITAILFHVFLDGSITDQTTNFLVSGLQATAAIVGIVFALSIIAIEHSASNYSPALLGFFKKDYFVWFTAGYGLFTIGFIGSTIMFGGNFTLLCFIFFLWNLALLGIYLRYTLDLVNPIYLNKKIRGAISETFKKISKKIEKTTNEKIKNDSLYRGLQPSMIKSVVMDYDKNLLKDVEKYETLIQNLIFRSYKKNEYESTESAFLSYPQIIKQYIELNPNHYWPNDRFFELIQERIKGYAYDAVKNKDVVFLKQVIDSSVQIGHEMTNIKKLDSPMAYNEPLVHLIYALSKISKEYISWDTNLSDREWEGVLQITRALGKLGSESVIKSGDDSQAGNQILEIGMLALKKLDTFSCFTCINQSFKIFQERARFPPNNLLKPDLKQLREFTQLAYKLPQSTFHGNSFFFEGSGINPYEYAKNAIISCQENLDGETEITQRAWRIQTLKEHISLILNFIGNIEHFNKQNILIKIMIMYLQNAQRMFHEPFTPKDEIKIAISSLSNSDEKLEGLVELAILCIEYELEESAILCIERISLIAKNTIKNDEYSYRTLRELNLIGCYLQLHPNDKILDKVIEKIIEFDEQFEQHYKHTTRDELSLDLPEWASPSWEMKYKNLDRDFKNEIMHIDNRIKFEMRIVNAKIKHLQNR